MNKTTTIPIRAIFDSMHGKDFENDYESFFDNFIYSINELLHLHLDDNGMLIDMYAEWVEKAKQHDIDYFNAPSKWEFCTQFYCAYYGIANELKDEVVEV